jgi:hypothetical protein
MFIKYLAEQGHNVVKAERKPRKTVQYKDLGSSSLRLQSTIEWEMLMHRSFRGVTH